MEGSPPPPGAGAGGVPGGGPPLIPAPSAAPGDEEQLRSAFLRLADPVGTPARLAYLVAAFGCVGAYGFLQPRGWVPRVVPYLLVAVAAYYAIESLRARHLAKRATSVEIRESFRKKAAAALDLAPSLPVRAVVWLGLGAWAWVTVARGGDFPFGGDRGMALFVGGIGSLLGARYLFEWRIEVPALRRDLAAVEPPPRT